MHHVNTQRYTDQKICSSGWLVKIESDRYCGNDLLQSQCPLHIVVLISAIEPLRRVGCKGGLTIYWQFFCALFDAGNVLRRSKKTSHVDDPIHSPKYI